MTTVAGLAKQVSSLPPHRHSEFLSSYQYIKVWAFFVFCLPALVSDKIHLPTIDEEAAARGGRVS